MTVELPVTTQQLQCEVFHGHMTSNYRLSLSNRPTENDGNQILYDNEGQQLSTQRCGVGNVNSVGLHVRVHTTQPEQTGNETNKLKPQGVFTPLVDIAVINGYHEETVIYGRICYVVEI